MKKSKLIALILVVCVACSALIAGTAVYKANKGEFIEFAKNTYSIVFSLDSEKGSSLSNNIFNAMKENGVSVTRRNDSFQTEGNKIIIGNCDCPETKTALEILNSKGKGYDADYIIYETGGNIVIVGNSESATEQAVNRFLNFCVVPGGIESGMVYTSLASSVAKTTIMVNEVLLDRSFYIITPKYNLSYIVRIQIDALKSAIAEKTGYSLLEYNDRSVTKFTQNDVSYFMDKTWGNCESAEDYANYVNKYNTLNKTVNTTRYTYEIVIGNCDRTGCPEITNDDDYTIKVSGNKIFLNGGSPYATAMAVSEFTKMVNAGDVVLTDASTFTADYYDALPGYDRNNYYTLSWGDDFEGTEIDENLWHVAYGNELIYSTGLNGRTPMRASKELKNNYVKDGCLYIAAMYDDEHYYGGYLSTKDTMRVNYGYVELSCLKPFGQGFWSTLWVDNDGCLEKDGLARMEIDVNESYGPGHLVLQNSFAWPTTYGYNSMLDKYGFKLNNGVAFDKSNIQYNADTRGFHMDFHTFGYAWDENKLFFTIDGKVTNSYNYATEPMKYANGTENQKAAELAYTKDAFGAPAFLRLSMAVGYGVRKYIVDDDAAEWTKSNKFIVDYVHVYQLEGQTMYYKDLAIRNRLGDVTGDNKVDSLDAAYLSRYLANWSRYDFKHMDLAAADLDGDDLVTEKDLNLLNGFLTGDNDICK